MMTGWNAPFSALIAAAVIALVWRPRVAPLERALGFFGVGGLEAASATAIVLATAGLVGLIYNDVAPSLVQSYGAGHFSLALLTGLALGIALASISSRLAGDDREPS